MLLGETVAGLCETPLFKYSPAQDLWLLLEQPCTLSVYDRFISDRAFGQKKRILHTPGVMPPLEPGYYRVYRPEAGPVYILESDNQDVSSEGPYLNTYMLRQVKYQLRVLVRTVVETLPTGQDRTMLVPAPQLHWCDLDVYSSFKSDELPTQHTQWNMITASFMDLPADSVVQLSIGNTVKNFRIAERLFVLDTNSYRLVEHHG